MTKVLLAHCDGDSSIGNQIPRQHQKKSLDIVDFNFFRAPIFFP
jgi:hypothetical protein